MQKLQYKTFAACAVLCVLFFSLYQLSAEDPPLGGEQIIDRVEANQVHTSTIYSGKMEIKDRFGTRAKTFKAWSKGTDKSLMQFTNPEEYGQKILRLKDEVYLYFPSAEQIISLKGNALKDSVMGSDFSYEDLTRDGKLKDKYEIKLAGTVEIDGNTCYALELTATVKDVAYAKQKLWVDKALFAVRKAEYFSVSGRLLREFQGFDFKTIKGKTIPTIIIMSDKLKKDSQTTLYLLEVQLDVEVADKLFSLEELSW